MNSEELPKLDNQSLADLLVMQWTAGTLSENSAMSDRVTDQIKELLDNKDSYYTKKVEELRNLVLDDVPHQYQRRLLEVLK